MHLFVALQARVGWQFDIRSAVIGLAFAWIVAAVLYSQRQSVGAAIHRVWTPVTAWRSRARASQEEKYLRALYEQLRHSLLFEPADLSAIFVPPALRAPAPLPTSVADVATAPRTIAIPYTSLLSGHPCLVLSGTQGSGRTTAMASYVDQALQNRVQTTPAAQRRLPIWVDLTQAPPPATSKASSAADAIVAAATAFLPAVLTQWLLHRLRREPCLLLLDNWEELSPDRRAEVACWISEAKSEAADAFWIVSTAPEGYSELTAIGFVPVEIISQGDPPWERNTRTLVHLQTGDLPSRPVEVIDRYIAHKIGAVSLGKVSEQIIDSAQQVALDVLMAVASGVRLKGQPTLTNKDMRDLLEVQLQGQGQQDRRLEDAVRKLLAGSGILRQDSRTWHIVHPILADYLTACHLVQEEIGGALIEAHLDDPRWHLLTEFYAGMADIGPLGESLFSRTEIYGDRTILTRVARWATVADPESPNHKALVKVLARSFMLDTLSPETREDIGRAIAVSAGSGARAFFVQMLRNASPDIRGAALWGLGLCRADSDLALLIAALHDEQTAPRVRESAVRALLELGSDEAVAALAGALTQVDQALMFVIAEALAAAPQGGEALEEGTRHPDLFVRRAAAYGLGRISADWAREKLLEMAREDQEWMVRSAAEVALQAQDESEQENLTVTAPPQPDRLDWLMSWAARQGEGLGVGEAAMVMLQRAAREGNADAKVLSALTLAQIGRDSEVAVLEPLMASADPLVAQSSAWAVHQIRRRHRYFQAA